MRLVFCLPKKGADVVDGFLRHGVVVAFFDGGEEHDDFFYAVFFLSPLLQLFGFLFELECKQ